MKLFRTLHYIPRIDGHILDDGIGIWTILCNSIRWPLKIRTLKKLYCSHLEIWTPDENGHFEDETGYLGTCWTSTMRGEENGAVCRLAREVLDHPDRWYVGQYETDDESYNDGIKWMQDKVDTNQGYGKFTILTFFWIRRKTKEVNGVKQYICSGFTDNAFDIMKCKSPYDIPSPIRWSLWAFLSRKKLGGIFFRLKDYKEL